MAAGLKTSCYLGYCAQRDKPRVVKALLSNAAVVRVTDHGPHLKVITKRRLPKIRGFDPRLVLDKTTHWDVKYWDFAMAIARHITTKRQSPHDAIGVLNHYLCNVLGLPEPELMDFLASGNRYIQKAYTDEQAHGWEIKALR